MSTPADSHSLDLGLLLAAAYPAPPRHPSIVQNALRLTDGGDIVYLLSIHVHDFVSHTFKDGAYAACDGGTVYLKRVTSLIKPGQMEEWSLMADDPFEVMAARLLWGTYGQHGDQPLRRVPFAECTLDHLKAIKRTESGHISPLCLRIVDHWIAAKSARGGKGKRRG